jgi:hypothetical protein
LESDNDEAVFSTWQNNCGNAFAREEEVMTAVPRYYPYLGVLSRLMHNTANHGNPLRNWVDYWVDYMIG